MEDSIVTNYSRILAELGIEHEIVEHPELKSPPEVQGYLGLTLADGLSTMLMKAGDNFIAIVRRDDCRMDFGKIKKVAGVKELRMANAEEFVRLTGLPLGAAQVYNEGVRTFLDEKLFEKEYLTGGSGSFTCSFRYKAEDLKKIPGSKVVDITKEEKE
jgi:prolyl-tRNA editing enzyme YbaK/EbsC (Cys-tRNA(Pro) deacylase)